MTRSATDEAAPLGTPTGWERDRQIFIGSLRKAVMVDVGGGMRAVYEDVIEPKLAAKPATGRDVLKAMEDRRIYRFYTSLRYNAQEMVFESVRPQVERAATQINAAAASAPPMTRAGGSLTLDPSITIPAYLSEMDTHLLPGGFHAVHADGDDALQGARSVMGSEVFGFGIPNYNVGGPGATIANFLRVRYPEFAPRKIVDLGCTAGRNTVPYVEMFPHAEVYGVDISAPMLRYGHVQAEANGHRIHFVQADAASLPFADDSMDFITSAFFLHELPVKLTAQVLRECYRVLRPGGLMMMFELPPSKACSPYHDFFLNWDAYYNNEPSYAAYRAKDPAELCAAAGFAPENYIQHQLFNWGTLSEADFEANALGDKPATIGWGGASWFTYGAWK